eukprot:scpid38365/ scgid16153/ 
MSLLQSWGIIDTISSHSNDLVHVNELLNKFSLVLWFNSRENFSSVSRKCSDSLLIVQSVKFLSSPAILLHVRVFINNRQFFGNCNSGIFGISGDHDDTDSSCFAFFNSLFDFWSNWIFDAHKSEESATSFVVVIFFEISEHLACVLFSKGLEVSTIIDDSACKTS